MTDKFDFLARPDLGAPRGSMRWKMALALGRACCHLERIGRAIDWLQAWVMYGRRPNFGAWMRQTR